jgi:methionyl-tRNA synthetase
MTASSERQFAIVAPPPTPNGDLHVGHLSGPYLGADVLARYLKLKGAKVTSALSVDLNQTYVVTTAERLACEPMGLARKSHREVTDTLNAANIDFDVVGIPNQAYSDYVTSWFEKLYAAGVLKRQKRQAPYDPKRGRVKFE